MMTHGASPGSGQTSRGPRRTDVVGIAAVLLAVAAFAAGYEILVPHRHPPAGITLANLTTMQQLETRFNHDRGETRLILIFSPT